MRSAVISFRYRLVPAFVLVLVVGLLPLVGALPAASADEADAEAMPLVAASQLVREVSLQPLSEGGSGVPLVADALAGQPTRFVNQVVALDGDASVLGSFTVDGMTYAVTGEGTVELVAVAPVTLASDLAAGLAGAAPAGSDGAPSGEGSGSGVPTSPSPSPEGEPSDGAEGEEASEPVTLDIPDSVEHDGIAYSVTSIGPRALAGCDADVARIPASVAFVDEAAFRGSLVGGVEVAEGNPYLASCEGVLYDADCSDLLLIPEGKEGVVRIPSNTSAVPPDAFSHCASVTAVEVDAGSDAFYVEDGCLYDAAGRLLASFPANASIRSSLEAREEAAMGAASSSKAAGELTVRPGRGCTMIKVLMNRHTGEVSSEKQVLAADQVVNMGTILQYQIVDSGQAYLQAFLDANNWYDIFFTVPGYKATAATDLLATPEGALLAFGKMYSPPSALYFFLNPMVYGVTLDRAGGTGGDTYAIATYGATFPTVKVPSRTGYTFLGYWDGQGSEQYCDAAGKGTKAWWITGDGLLVAHWKANSYKVSFDANGGLGGQSAQVTATYDAAMPGISTAGPTRNGYTFAGWWDTSAATGGTRYYTAAGASARTWNKAANATLYARWVANQYTVTFGKAGGTGGTDSVTATFGQAMPAVTPPTRRGYAFLGYWNGEGTVQYYDAAGKGLRNWDWWGTGYLEAHWRANSYTVEYWDKAGASKVCPDGWFAYDSPGSLAQRPSSGVTTGYSAIGWAEAPNQSAKRFDFGQRVTTEVATGGTKRLYLAEVLSSSLVSFDANGGSGGQQDAVTATYSLAMPAILKDKPVRGGWRFVGWYDGPSWKASGTKRYYTDACESASNWDKVSDATLYAGWEALSYAISYDVAGGELAAGARGSYTVEDAFDLPVPTRYGYQFDGWDVSGVVEGGAPGPVLGAGVEDATAPDGSKVTRVKAGTYGDLSCTARWTLRYDLDVPVCDPGSVTFEADSMTGQVRVRPGTSAEGELRSYMAVPVALDELACEGLDADGSPDPAGGAPELEAIFGTGSASKVRFTATLGEGDATHTAKVTAGGASSTSSLAGLSIPAAISRDAPGRLAVAYGLELDPDLSIPPLREAAPVARLAYTVSLPGASV